MDHFTADDAALEYEVRGEGEPVLLIPLSGVVDGLAYPLFAQPVLAKYKLMHYHRRGTGGSTRGQAPLTFERQAADAAALLRHLGIRHAHVAGHSFGALIALQLAQDEPALVHSLALLEPPLQGVPSGHAAGGQLFPPIIQAYRAGDKRKAVELFSEGVFGPGWQDIVEQAVPGGSEQALHDIDPFMEELAAYQQWQYRPKDGSASQIPVLHVLGVRSSQFMKEGRVLIRHWFPHAEDCDIQSTHLLQMQDPKAVAVGLADFFSSHPIS